MHAADPPSPLYPAEAWPLLRGLLAWVLDHAGGMIALVRRGRIARTLWRELNRHACALEHAARQMLLAMQTAPRIVHVQPFAATHAIVRGDPHPGDDPRAWSVSFRLFRAKPRPRHIKRPRATPDENPTVCARNFAARLEAVRRVIASPGRAARRLALRLQRSAEADEDRLFDGLSRAPGDPRPHESLFARTALAMAAIREACRDAWRRRRNYIAGLPTTRRP